MFAIIVGTYEKALYGFEVHPRNNSSSLVVPNQTLRTENVSDDEIDLELEKNYKYDLKPIFGYIAHMGCIKSLSATSRWLLSSSTDETIKYIILLKFIFN
jgi:hypothetical protein